MTTTKRPAAPPPLTQRLQAELFATAAFPGPAPRPFIDWRDKWARIWAGVLAFALALIAFGVLIHVELANRWLNWPGVFGYPV